MQKRKFSIILAILIIIPLIGLSATCLAPGEAPALELEIYDGPDYSESDDMCYYRVEATATGFPDPVIEFDDDDNVDLLGSGRVEVGVEVGESYTLTATATNSAGTAAVSIILVGECSEIATADEEADDEAADEEAEEEVVDDEEAPEEEESEEEKEAPTISLAIYEGPVLEGSICYYRIKATVTGSPSPEVNFSKDDSGGAWLPKRVQVNLNNPGDTYTLTATATNSEGSATDSIALSWGCAIPGPVETDVNINVTTGLSGYITVTQGAYPGADLVYVGDSSINKQVKTFLSFNITSLSGIDDATITEASVSMPLDSIEPVHNHPEMMPQVHIKVFYYGDSLELADQAAGGEFVKILPTSATLTNFNFSSTELVAELQDAIDTDKDRFQLKVSLSGLTSNNTGDYYRLYTSDVVLHIKYETPG